jgi:hypothetical protein
LDTLSRFLLKLDVMNAAHVHLILIHFPVAGVLLGAWVMILGMIMGSRRTQLAACSLFIIAAVGAGLSYQSGEGAEEVVEHWPGIEERRIEAHGESAAWTLASCMVLGATAGVGIYLLRKRSPFHPVMAGMLLLLALLSSGFALRTGYLGGQIRHPEIISGSTKPSVTNQYKQPQIEEQEEE